MIAPFARSFGVPKRQGRPCTRLPGAPAAAVLAFSIVLLVLSPTAPVRAQSGAESGGRYAILLAGASGDAELQKAYLDEVRKLYAALAGPLAFPREHIVVLSEDPGMAPDLIRHRSTREDLRNVCRDLAQRVGKTDLVFVFIEGHGSYDGKTYKLNLVGPDTTATELAEILYSIPAGRFVVVNATNSSGGSLPSLSGEGKIVITSTKSGTEGNLTIMGTYFVESLENRASDADKDDRVSVLEAFLYASRKVEDYYKNENNLQTEHSVLDDNGDGRGHGDPTPENGEGLLARTTFFNSGARPDATANLTPEERNLANEARKLETQIEALKYDKAQMPQSDYEKKLEELLLKLARINARLHK